MTTVAIIGTAGRKDDAAKLDRRAWEMMLSMAHNAAKRFNATTLVSGGAAWADHLAVRLHAEGVAPNLTLHMPALFDKGQYLDTGFQSAGGTANYYHRQFRKNAGVDGLIEIMAALGRPGVRTTVSRGFKERNTLVASADIVLAFTFGSNQAAVSEFAPGLPGYTDAQAAGLKPGGTADTWNKARQARLKIHFCLGPLLAIPSQAA